MSVLNTNIGKWLQAEEQSADGTYHFIFAEHHIGNVWIRSIHGGVSASIIEICAEAETRKQLEENQDTCVTTSTIDYLRITKDADIFANAKIIRKSRRLSIVDVKCWQDDKDTIVARGTVTLKISNTSD